MDISPELKEKFSRWNQAQHDLGCPYAAGGDWQIVCESAAKYGAPGAVSAFARALKELADAGTIKAHQRTVPTPIPANFGDLVNGLTAGQLRSKITPPAVLGRTDPNDLRADRVRDRAAGGYDPQFADWFRRWSAGERPQGAAANPANEYADFQAKDWHALPPDTLARLMQRKSFRERIDQLASQGAI